MKNATFLFSICMLLVTTAFEQAGTLDSSYGKNGKVIGRISRYCAAYDAVLQPDGKIVAAGTSFYDFMLLRYKKDGSLDKTFGNQGIVLTDFSGGDIGASVVVQPDGKIIVAGSTSKDTANNFALARYQQDGSLDSSLGLNGKVVTDFGISEVGNTVLLQSDGKIVLAGGSGYGPGENFALVRYKKNGRVDSSFGTNGEVITNLAGSDNHLNAAALQANGKFVVAGSVYTRYSDHPQIYFALARYKDNGNLDDSFGDHGKVLTDFGYDAQAFSMLIQPDGRIVAAGSVNAPTAAFGLARYRHNGDLDSSFGDNGKLITKGDATSVALQADGKIIVAGQYYQSFGVRRFRPNGRIDSSFGTDGVVTTSFSDVASSLPHVVLTQTDGKIVVVGQVSEFDFSFVAIARYNGDNTSAPVNGIAVSNVQPGKDATASIVLAPNPVRDVLRIDGLRSTSGGLSSSKSISIIDATGKLLKQVTTANNTHSFDTKQLTTGIYLVRISDGHAATTLKFFKE
jgi:uncharacterized delta-60 repeat protein